MCKFFIQNDILILEYNVVKHLYWVKEIIVLNIFSKSVFSYFYNRRSHKFVKHCTYTYHTCATKCNTILFACSLKWIGWLTLHRSYKLTVKHRRTKPTEWRGDIFWFVCVSLQANWGLMMSGSLMANKTKVTAVNIGNIYRNKTTLNSKCLFNCAT